MAFLLLLFASGVLGDSFCGTPHIGGSFHDSMDEQVWGCPGDWDNCCNSCGSFAAGKKWISPNWHCVKSAFGIWLRGCAKDSQCLPSIPNCGATRKVMMQNCDAQSGGPCSFERSFDSAASQTESHGVTLAASAEYAGIKAAVETRMDSSYANSFSNGAKCTYPIPPGCTLYVEFMDCGFIQLPSCAKTTLQCVPTKSSQPHAPKTSQPSNQCKNLPPKSTSCWSCGSTKSARDHACAGANYYCARVGHDSRNWGACGTSHCCTLKPGS